MNKKSRRDLFKRFKKDHPDAEHTRCYQGFIYDIADSHHAYVSAFEALQDYRIKIYKIGDCDWVAAKTKEEAIEYYETCSDFDPEEMEVEYVTAAGMKALTFREDYDAPKHSFQEELHRRIKAGDRFPQFFASTEY